MWIRDLEALGGDDDDDDDGDDDDDDDNVYWSLSLSLEV
jgi:hypothetical protein